MDRPNPIPIRQMDINLGFGGRGLQSNFPTLGRLYSPPGLDKMIGTGYSDWRSATIVAPNEYSIAEYNYITDIISFWGWEIPSVQLYRRRDESYFEMIIRVLSHEELHRVLAQFISIEATIKYDRIAEGDTTGLV